MERKIRKVLKSALSLVAGAGILLIAGGTAHATDDNQYLYDILAYNSGFVRSRIFAPSVDLYRSTMTSIASGAVASYEQKNTVNEGSVRLRAGNDGVVSSNVHARCANVMRSTIESISTGALSSVNVSRRPPTP